MVSPFVLILLALLLMIALGVPLMVAFGITSILLFLQSGTVGTMTFTGQMMVDGLKSFALLAIPLFIVTGDLIVVTGVAEDLFNFAESVMGSIPGGMGASAQVACGLFAAISGSNAADAAAIGRVSSNELEARGYPRQYAGGLVSSAAITGILIPPSISYIVLAVAMRLSISDLFIGTIIPGILVLASMVLVNFLITRHRGIDQEARSAFDLRQVGHYTWRAKYGLVVPVIILGGLYSGVFTATESAIAAILFMLGIGVLVQRDMTSRDYSDIIVRSAALNGMISPLVAIFVLFSQGIGFFQIPAAITEFLLGLSAGSNVLPIVAILFILILAGAFISTVPNILLLGPLLIPVGVELGYNTYHFSIFFLCVLALGFITPPVGLNLFVLSGVLDEPVEKIAIEAFPFFIAGLLAAIFILAVPETVTLLSQAAEHL